MFIEGYDKGKGKPAAFDITVTSPLCSACLAEDSQVAVAGAAAVAAETQRHIANDKKFQELDCMGMCSHCHRDLWQLGQKSTLGISPGLPGSWFLTIQGYCRPLSNILVELSSQQECLLKYIEFVI